MMNPQSYSNLYPQSIENSPSTNPQSQTPSSLVNSNQQQQNIQGVSIQHHQQQQPQPQPQPQHQTLQNIYHKQPQSIKVDQELSDGTRVVSGSQQAVGQHQSRVQVQHQPQQQQQQQPTQQNTVFSATLRRGPWSPDEDRKLLESINIYGPSNWVRISQSLGSRTPKQCRERYHQNLKPSLNRNPITPEEGQLIEDLVLKYGKRWAEIARHLNGRSDNAIKNWWNGGANRRRRASTQAVLEGSGNHPNQEQQQHRQHQQHVQPLTSDHSLQLGGPSFNTSIFQDQRRGSLPIGQLESSTVTSYQQLPPHQQSQFPNKYPAIPPHQQVTPSNSSRSSSITQDLFQQQPGVKRLLEEQNYPLRRHSAQIILTSTIGSASPLSRADSSRNSSVSNGDWNGSFVTASSTGNSRRSSLAHELFPNPNKRHNSQTNTYLSPNLTSHRSSITIPSGLTPLSQTHQAPPPSSVTPFAVPDSHKDPIFRSNFTFNKSKESIKLPPPSSIYANPNFNLGNSSKSVINEENVKNSEKNEQETDLNENGEPSQIMNISNLLS